MSNSTPLPPWPPKRPRNHDENHDTSSPSHPPLLRQPSSPALTAAPVTPANISRSNIAQEPHLSPFTTPLSDKLNRVTYRNGFTVKPRTPSYKPFSINNPGHTRQKVFSFPGRKKLTALEPLDHEGWNGLAVAAGVLQREQVLRDYQVEGANYIISRSGDICVIAPTGAGKSLLWVLPLLAQKQGISLVIIPYTSLGHQGHEKHIGTKIRSTFLHSGASSPFVLEGIARGGDMHVVYTCAEMLETPAVARVIHSESFQAQLSGIYIDEAHVVHESSSWRPAYTRLHLLRKILGTEMPMMALSATFPERYRASLTVHAGMLANYHLINLGNHRPELSVIVRQMQHEATSFLDLAFVLPSHSTAATIPSTIIYADDLELLTCMFWWFHKRLASFGLPANIVDILHAGLSATHQQKCTEDFIAGKSRILLGSDKIGAGMDFPGVTLVIQYRCRDLTLVRWEQRRGRGARRAGMTAVGVILVEKSMSGNDGKLSVASPGHEDPALLDYIHTDSCHTEVGDHWLGNPARNSQCRNCSNCNPSISIALELTWMEQENYTSSNTRDRTNLTGMQKKELLKRLTEWRFNIWKAEWMDKWPSYGPQSLVQDSDLEEISRKAHLIHTFDDLYSSAQILHIDELAQPILLMLKDFFSSLSGPPNATVALEIDRPATPNTTTFHAVQWATIDNPTTMEAAEESLEATRKRKAVAADIGEFILNFD